MSHRTLLKNSLSRTNAAHAEEISVFYRPRCGCHFCVSIRHTAESDQIHRRLAEAAASGDEIWYSRILKEFGAQRLKAAF